MLDLAIVGGGPAGIAAAVQCRRSGIDAVLFEKQELGGLLREANMVENYMGFPGGIPGAELSSKFESHLISHGVEVRREEVLMVERDGDSFILSTAKGDTRSRRLILATGTIPAASMLGIGVDDRTVFDSILPLKDHKGKSIAVLGAGDAAYDYALRLAAANKVTIISRGRPRCLAVLRQRALAHPSISFLEGATVRRTESDDALRVILDVRGAEEAMMPDALLLAVGRVPNTIMIGASVSSSSEQLIKDGLLYIIGDLANGDRRQVSIAAADGIQAAMSLREAMRL